MIVVTVVIVVTAVTVVTILAEVTVARVVTILTTKLFLSFFLFTKKKFTNNFVHKKTLLTIKPFSLIFFLPNETKSFPKKTFFNQNFLLPNFLKILF